MLFETLGGGQVECRLCAHGCRLEPGQTGLCRVRHNADGTLLTSSYGRPVMVAVEPIEKKYLFHVLPGSQTLSLGTSGCNLSCRFCINWRVSQSGVDGHQPEMEPDEVVEKALTHRVKCIAFTYTELTIFFEYALEIARRAHHAGLVVVAQTNGFMSPAVLQQMAPWLDAINVDLKGWQDAALGRLTSGSLEPVLDNLKLANDLGIWVEVSTVVVPGLNDHPSDLEKIARFISTELGPDTPWHVLRFFPNYRMLDRPVTSHGQLQQAVDKGRVAGLRYVYAKDLSKEMLHTTCPRCQNLAVRRKGLALADNNLDDGRCGQCGQAIAGVGLGRHGSHVSEFVIAEEA